MVCSVSLSIACLGKQTPKALGFRGDDGNLAPFHEGLLWAAHLPWMRRWQFPHLLCRDALRKGHPLLVFMPRLPLSSPFPDMPTLKTQSDFPRVRTSASHSVWVATKASHSVFHLNLILICTKHTTGQPGPSNTDRCEYACTALSKRAEGDSRGQGAWRKDAL